MNFEYLFTAILPKLFSATVTSLILGAIVGGVIGLVWGKLARRIKDTFFPAILGSALGIMLFAMLPILSEPALRDGAGAYGGLFILMVLMVGGVPGSITGAIVGSICGLKLPRHLKHRVLWIVLAAMYSLMVVVIYLRTAPTPFQFTQTPTPSEQDILPLSGKIAGYDQGICCMSFTPDGQNLIIASGSNIRIWQVATGKLAHRFDGPPRAQTTLADLTTAITAVPDGKTFVTTSLEGIQVRDLTTGKKLQQFEGQHYTQLTSDGKTLISFVGYPNTAKADIGVWDLAQGKRRYLIPSQITPYTEVTLFDVSPDGKTLVIAPTTGRIEVWQLATGKQLKTFTSNLTKEITTLAVSPDGKTVIIAENHQLHLLALDTGNIIKVIPEVGKVETLLFMPNGETLISNGDSLSFWQWKTGEKRQSWVNDLGKLADEIALSPDGKTLAAYAHGIVKLWKIPPELL